MASLTGQKIKDTYQSLLKTDDNGLITNAFKGVTDGSGSASGLYLKNDGVQVNGTLVVSGSLLYSGSTINATVTSASYALTASYALNGGGGGSTDTGSLLVTASVSSNTITFTKGDATTFDITVDTGSAAATDTGSLIVTASVSSNTITFTKGDATTFDITVDTGSVDLSNYVTNSQTSSMSVATASYVENAQTASYYVETDPIFVGLSASLATTGSNTFIGTQTISGSIQISGSIIPATDGVSTTSSFSLGSATNAWKDIFVSNGTINFLDGAGNVQAALSSTDQGLQIQNYPADTGSIPVFNVSGSGAFTDGLTITGSLVQGLGTQAIGVASHAEGNRTIASGSYQHVSGQYNQHNNDTSYFVVGIGLTEETRKDGFTVDVDANGSGSVMIPNNLDAPSVAKTGSMYVDPANNKLWIYTGNGGINGWVTSSLG